MFLKQQTWDEQEQLEIALHAENMNHEKILATARNYSISFFFI